MPSPHIPMPRSEYHMAQEVAKRDLEGTFDSIRARIEAIIAKGLSAPAIESPTMQILRGKVRPAEHIFHYGAQDPANAFLDNFYPSSFRDNAGVEYRTAEHYYQSRKTADPELRRWIVSAPTAAEAKRRGQSLKSEQMVPDWETGKVAAMREALMLKFMFGVGPNGEDLMRRLMETGQRHLHEDSPGDRIWGIEGHDLLGILQEQVRASVRLRCFYRG